MRATHVLLGIATLWGIWAGSHWLLAGPDELQPTLPRPVNDVESVPIQRNLATKATVKPPSVKAPPKATPRPATTAVSVPKACKICDEKMDPPVPPTLNASTSLICQGFWHRRFPGKGPDEMWPHCLKDGLEERKELRKTLCSLCKEGAAAAKSPPKTTPKAGILFSIGRHHLHLVSASIKYLRKSLKWTGPIEVYCDNDGCKSDCTEALEGQSVDCEVLKQKFVVRYTSKLLAVLQTRLDYVLMLDADNFLIRSPAEVFDDPAFKRGVSFGWPDLWGSACQNYQWSVTDDNPRGVMLAGQSSWRDHVLWPILDLPWKPEWAYSVELTSSIFAVNKRTPYAVQAWKLAAWMTERPFWAKVLYGDKDTIRLSFLLLGVPFELLVEPPGQVVRSNNPGKSGRRNYLINKFRQKPISIDQIKGRPSLDVYVIDPKKSVYPTKGDNSYCAPEYDAYANDGQHFDWDDSALHQEIIDKHLHKLLDHFD